MPRPEQRDVVLAGGAQDLADLRDQRVDVVSHPPLAELSEARQVAADLRGVHVRVVGQLLGRDRLLAHLLGLREDLEVARKTRRDAERQTLLGSVLKPQGGLLEAHEATLSRRSSRESRSTKYSNASSPFTARTGMRSPYSLLSPGSSETSTSTSSKSRSRRTDSTIARASSQRWQPGLP